MSHKRKVPQTTPASSLIQAHSTAGRRASKKSRTNDCVASLRALAFRCIRAYPQLFPRGSDTSVIVPEPLAGSGGDTVKAPCFRSFNLSTGYVKDWTVADAIRELIQNLLDGSKEVALRSRLSGVVYLAAHPGARENSEPVESRLWFGFGIGREKENAAVTLLAMIRFDPSPSKPGCWRLTLDNMGVVLPLKFTIIGRSSK
jgi:hypothetical protein